jgi:quercetin dioxygenase-like cupin family protein/ActR/RegA family two-component response regulator
MGQCAILCVDDEAIILLALKNELRDAFGERFLYETALGAEQALASLERLTAEGIRIILVISDWLMPGIKGDEFLAIVRERYPGTKAIMITGQADAATIQRALEDGRALSVLSKPWSSDELTGLIERWCCGDPGDGFHDLLPGIRIRTLAHGEGSLMAEFLLKKGSELPIHSHPYEQSGYLLRGRLRLSIGGAAAEAGPDDSWCIAAGVPHRAEVLEDSAALEVFSPAREDYLKYI